MSGSFVALDVETANRHRGSICCIGLAIVDDGRIVRSEQWLTRPPATISDFEGYNIGIHGIHERDVTDQPGFADRLSAANDLIGDLPVVAHSAAFDVGAITQACEAESLPVPSWLYACSMTMARRLIPSDSYRLNSLCERLEIPLDHHQAGADSAACALLTLHMMDLAHVDDLDELAAAVRVPLRRVGDPHPSSSPSRRWPHTPRNSEMPIADTSADPDHPLYGETIVFTGKFSRSKSDYWDEVADVGATPTTGVTKKTTILVVGDGWKGETWGLVTAKAQRVLELRQRGHFVRLMTEAQLLHLLDGDSTPDGDWDVE